MSNFLAIDTSSRYLTVVAAKGGKTAKRYLPDCAMRHSVILMDEIDKALKEINLTPAECDFFCAVTGPGSFTGIRIGISAVKGFALAANKPMLGVTSFEMLSYNVKDENFYTVIDALHSHYYVCGFGACAGKPAYMSGEEVTGLNAPLYGFEDLPLKNYVKLNAESCLLPAVLALKDNLSDELYALYVRKSQAEEARGEA